MYIFETVFMYLSQDTFLRRLVDHTQTYQPLSSANPNLKKFGIRTRKLKTKISIRKKSFHESFGILNLGGKVVTMEKTR